MYIYHHVTGFVLKNSSYYHALLHIIIILHAHHRTARQDNFTHLTMYSSCPHAVAQRVSSKESWNICDVEVKVFSITSNCTIVQGIVEKYTPDNTIVIEDIPEGVNLKSPKCQFNEVTELEEDDFTLEHKGSKALMVLLGEAAG